MTRKITYFATWTWLPLALFFAAVGFSAFAADELLGADAIVFLPQTVPYREQGELINPVWPPAAKLDPTGAGRMTYHGFLFPMLLGQMMGRSDYAALSTTLAALYVAAAVLYCVLLGRLSRRWTGGVLHRQLLVTALVAFACASYLRGGVGRPETLAAIILMGTVLALSHVAETWHGRLAGIGIGLVTAVDPIIGVFGGLVFAGYATWRHAFPRAALEIVGTAGVALIVFAVCIAWYPYSFADWLYGTLRMGTHALGNVPGARAWPLFLDQIGWLPVVAKAAFGLIYEHVPFLKGAFFLDRSWFLVATFPLVAWAGLRLLRRQHRQGAGPRAPLAFYATLLAGAWAIDRFVLYVGWARYNIHPLMPLGLLLVGHELARQPDPGERPPRVFRWAAITILVITSASFHSELFQRLHLARYSPTLTEARAKLRAIRQENPGAIIALHENLFTLTEDFANIVFWNETIPASATLLVDAEGNRRTAAPVDFAGFRLVANHYSRRPMPRLVPPFTPQVRGPGFAVYDRDPSPAPR